MITDQETNCLYLADTLSRVNPDFFNRFSALLYELNIKPQLLPGTKDIWAVDYMPVQISDNEFIQFTYNPDYLQSKKWHSSISNTSKICSGIGINAIKSNIIIDGGNVIRSANKVIMCDKVFLENPELSRKQLIKELEELFKTDQLYFVPQQPKDYTGHADGMLRFINDNTVIINDYKNEKDEFKRAFQLALHNAKLDYMQIPYQPHTKSGYAIGYYINYLQMENIVIVPVFNTSEDEMAVKQFEQLFYRQRIATINCNDIAYKGGVLNCISWNILKVIPPAPL